MRDSVILAVTGHRPHKLPREPARLQRFASAMIKSTAPDAVITGMALGWDLIIAEACRRARIPFYAYVPGLGQESRWTLSDQEQYHFLLAKAALVVRVTNDPCEEASYELRNRRMVDDCTELSSFWNGSFGGTANCIRYAVDVGRPHTNWFTQWLEYKG